MTQAPAGITGPSRLSKPAWTLVLASLGLFMSALHNTVVTTALPVLRVSLHSSLSSLAWTVGTPGHFRGTRGVLIRCCASDVGDSPPKVRGD